MVLRLILFSFDLVHDLDLLLREVEGVACLRETAIEGVNESVAFSENVRIFYL